jgi:hypothetical protein
MHLASNCETTSAPNSLSNQVFLPPLLSTPQRQSDMNGRNMEPTSSAIGLIVIVALYVTIGVMSAAGSVYIAKSIFSAKVEQIFFGLFLIPIAGFYLAFTAYFGDKDAWQLEATAAAVFAVFGLMGVRVPSVLIVGYLLHGLWDTVHEFNAHAGGSVLGARQTTSVPLAYGFFCATYDFLMATYFYTRRAHWRAAWSADSGSAAIA